MQQVTRVAILSLLLLASSETVRAQAVPAVSEAAKAGDHETLGTLIAGGANVDAPQGDGATALHWAAHLDDADAARLLLDAGASVNAANDLGATPLWLASTSGTAALVQALLDAGADPDVTLRMGETPLMAAAFRQPAGARAPDREWRRRQRHREGTRTDRLDVGGRAEPRRRRPSARRPRGRPRGTHRRVESTREYAGNTNGAGNIDLAHGGSTPLLFVARAGDLETARTLVALGANVNDTAASGTSALVIAAHSGHTPLGIYLLEQGADPNAADGGYTALHAAALRGELGLVQALIEYGADPNARLERGTPGRRFSTDYSLFHQFVGANAFWLAASYGEPEILRVLAGHGADASITPRSGMSSLQAAIGIRQMRYYKNRRDQAGIPTPDPADEEKLILDLARIAVDSGVDINATDNGGNTALHDAVRGGFGSVVEFLAAEGADLNVSNEEGHTAFALAEARRPPGDSNGLPAPRSEIAELLLRLGARD